MRVHAQRWPLLARYFSRYFYRRQSASSSTSPPWAKDYDVVIAGGGIMGCSSAYFLASRIPPSSICVVERDTKVHIKVCLLMKVSSVKQVSLFVLITAFSTSKPQPPSLLVQYVNSFHWKRTSSCRSSPMASSKTSAIISTWTGMTLLM